MQVRDIVDADVEAVLALWQRAGLMRPWNDPLADLTFARASPTATVLVGHRDERLVGAVMVGHDGHRGALYYLAAEPDRRRLGLGRALVAAAEDWLRARGVWKVNLLVRDGNADALHFYAALGYGDQRCHVLGRRLDGRPDRALPDTEDTAPQG